MHLVEIPIRELKVVLELVLCRELTSSDSKSTCAHHMSHMCAHTYLLDNPKHLHKFLGEVTGLPFVLNLSNFIIHINPLASGFKTKHKNKVLYSLITV